MSFSKAKIQRFNELSNDVPSPGAYDPKSDVNVKGVVIKKSEKLRDDKRTANAECKLSVSTKSSGNANISFRTSKIPRKCNNSRFSAKTRLCTLTPNSDSEFQYESGYQITNLEAECTNKVKTIQEQENHIENMKEEAQKLRLQLEELRIQRTEMKEQLEADTKTMIVEGQHNHLGNDKNYQTETDRLRCQLLEATNENDYEIKTGKGLKSDLTNRAEKFLHRVTDLESEMAKKKHTNEKKIQTLEARIEEILMKQEKLIEKHKIEVSTLEEEKSKLNFCINDLTEERDELELKLEKRHNVVPEVQAQLSALQGEVYELKAKREKITEDCSKQVNMFMHKHKTEIDKLKIDFKTDKATFQNENKLEICCRLEDEGKLNNMNKENDFLKTELQNVQQLYENVNCRLKETHKELKDSDEKHNIILQNHKEELIDVIKLHSNEKLELKKELENLRLNYQKDKENLTVTKNAEIAELMEATANKVDNEVKRMKEHTDKMVKNIEAVNTESLSVCRANTEERVKNIITESNAKVNHMINETTIVVKEEMQLTAQNYKASLLCVEMEQAILEKKFKQMCNEIDIFSTSVETLKSAKSQESFDEDLQLNLNKVEAELITKKKALNILKGQIRSEATKMETDNKKLEALIAENQASVTALTESFVRNNVETKSLQSELEYNENYLHEYYNLLNIMRNNSRPVHEHINALLYQFNTVKELINQFESKNLKEAETIRSVYEAKIKDLQEIIKQKIAKLQADCITKDAKNIEIDQEFHAVKNQLNNAQNMVLKLEEKTNSQQCQLSQVEMLNYKLHKQIGEDTAVIENKNKLLETQSAEYEVALQEANHKIQEHCHKIVCFEEKNDYTQHTTELLREEKANWEAFEKVIMDKLEEEKACREAAEEEIKKLAEHNESLKKNYQDVKDKYAKIIGHQNHKQRIKHVSQLKDRISQLEQGLQTRIRKVEQQRQIIENLQSQIKHVNEKEDNLLEISKCVRATSESSPHKLQMSLKTLDD